MYPWGQWFHYLDREIKGEGTVLLGVVGVEADRDDNKIVVTSCAMSKFFSDKDHALVLDKKHPLAQERAG